MFGDYYSNLVPIWQILPKFKLEMTDFHQILIRIDAWAILVPYKTISINSFSVKSDSLLTLEIVLYLNDLNSIFSQVDKSLENDSSERNHLL